LGKTEQGKDDNRFLFWTSYMQSAKVKMSTGNKTPHWEAVRSIPMRPYEELVVESVGTNEIGLSMRR
jgi:hypothetical protein